MHPLLFSESLLKLVAIFIAATFSWALTLTFIDPSNRFLRASIFLVSLAVAAQLQYENLDFVGNGTYNGLFFSLVWMLILRAFDILLWRDGGIHMTPQTVALLQHKQPSSSIKPSAISRLLTAWWFIFNLRNVNTPWAIKNLPAPSKYGSADKIRFVASRLAQALITYLSLDAIITFLPPPNPSVDVPEYKEYIFSRLKDISVEEIVARPFTIIIPGFCIYGIFTIPFNITSIIAVLFCGDEPQNWPPLWGNLGDAYSLRRFWGLAWHQMFRSFLESSASFISTYILCIPPQRFRLLSCYARLYLAFYISALIHVPGGVALGTSPFATGGPKFFLMQAIGITIEGTVIHLSQKLQGDANSNKILAGRVTRYFGFLWTMGWLCWTGPGFTWATTRGIDPSRDKAVPWSFLQWLGLGTGI